MLFVRYILLCNLVNHSNILQVYSHFPTPP